jgi:EmrB/QacA subfamily drug resistance transporter
MLSDQMNIERRVLIAAILASSMAFIDGSALNVALPSLQVDLGASASQLLWIVNAYLLMLSALILVGGSLGDHYGRKRIFSIGIALFALASGACSLAPSSKILIIARMFQGVGGALMIPGSLALISASFEPSRRGKAIGTWSALSTVTTLLGPVLGGFLASQGLWRGIFLINLPIAIVALIALKHVPDSRESTPTPLDWGGTILISLGLAGLTYGFIEAPNLGFSTAPILISLGIGILALLVFPVVERSRTHPLIPFSLFRSPTFLGANLLTLFLYAALNHGLFFFTLNLIQIQDYDASIAGLTILPFGILLTLLSRLAGSWADRVGPKWPLTIGPAIVALGFIWMAFPLKTGGPGDYWTTFFPSVVLLGVGMGITVAPLSTAVMTSVSAECSGLASGINNAVARTAGVLGIAIVGAVVLSTFQSQLHQEVEAINLSTESSSALSLEASKLGAAEAPEVLDPADQILVREGIERSFVASFRIQTWIAAVLSGLSALIGFLLIERRPTIVR